MFIAKNFGDVIEKRFQYVVSLRKEKKNEILKKKRSPIPLTYFENLEEITKPTNLEEIFRYLS